MTHGCLPARICARELAGIAYLVRRCAPIDTAIGSQFNPQPSNSSTLLVIKAFVQAVRHRELCDRSDLCGVGSADFEAVELFGDVAQRIGSGRWGE